MALNDNSHPKKSHTAGPNTTGSNTTGNRPAFFAPAALRAIPRSGEQARRPSAQVATVLALFILFIRYAKPGH